MKMHRTWKFYSPEGFGSSSVETPASPDNERKILDDAFKDPGEADTNQDKDDEGGEQDSSEDTGEDRAESGEEDSSELEEDSEELGDDDVTEDEEFNEEDLEEDSVYQTIKKIDKDIFKKVPQLRATIFREQQFTEVFSTPQDAKAASEKAEILDRFEKDLRSGNSENLFQTLSRDKKAFTSFAANILPTLEKTDKDLYASVLTPVFKNIFRNAAKSGNDALVKSAQNLHWFLFGHTDLDKEEGIRPNQKDEREESIEKKEQEFFERQYQSFSSDVYTVGQKRAKFLIQKGFEGTDLSDLSKKHLTEEIYSRVTQALERDVRYGGHMKSLWQKAAKEGFTQAGKDSIISAFLSRAKVLIPQFRQKVLAEAKIAAKSSNGRKPKRVPSSGSGESRNNGSIKPESGKIVDWSKTTESMALEGKYVYKS